MRGLSLWKAAVRLLLGGMDQIGKLDGILDEENGHVITNNVPVAFLGVQLYRKTSHIACEVAGAFISRDGRKPYKRRYLLSGSLKQIGASDLCGKRTVLAACIAQEDRATLVMNRRIVLRGYGGR